MNATVVELQRLRKQIHSVARDSVNFGNVAQVWTYEFGGVKEIRLAVDKVAQPIIELRVHGQVEFGRS